jgi:hypothetical protein
VRRDLIGVLNMQRCKCLAQAPSHFSRENQIGENQIGENQIGENQIGENTTSKNKNDSRHKIERFDANPISRVQPSDGRYFVSSKKKKPNEPFMPNVRVQIFQKEKPNRSIANR